MARLEAVMGDRPCLLLPTHHVDLCAYFSCHFLFGDGSFQGSALPVQMSGSVSIGPGGSITLKEEDGLDYQATTVQLPGGERVPFLFTIKELEAKGTVNGFGGEFTVPSYRGATFLDPKGRGGATGYDNAVALPARSDAEELLKENVKSTVALKGTIRYLSPNRSELQRRYPVEMVRLLRSCGFSSVECPPLALLRAGKGNAGIAS